MENSKFSGYKVAFGCFLVMFIHLGMLSSVGVFIPRIAEGLNVPVGRVSLMVTFAMIVAFLMSFVTPRMLQKFNPRVLMYIASFFAVGHYLMFAFAPNVYVVWLAAALGGITLGFGTNAVCAAVLGAWFIRNRASIVGIVFGGAAVGAAVFQFIGGITIAAVGWRTAYIIIGVAGAAIALLANILFVRDDPEKLGQKALGWDDIQETATAADNAQTVVQGVTATEAMKTASFWLLFVGVVVGGFLITGFQSFAPAFWQENGMEAVRSASYLSLYSLLGCLGVMLAGVIADKFGNKGFLTIILLAYVLGLFCATRYATNQSVILVLLTCILVAISYPASTSIPATVTTGAFGNKDYAKIVAYLMAALYLGKCLVSPVMSAIAAKTGGLMGGFIALIIFGIITWVLCMLGLITAPVNKMKSTK